MPSHDYKARIASAAAPMKAGAAVWSAHAPAEDEPGARQMLSLRK